MDTANKSRRAASGLLPFDPIVVVQDVVKRWFLILLAAAVVGVGSYILTDYMYEPVFRAETTLVVSAQSSPAVYGDLSSSMSLAAVFTDLLNSEAMRESILEQAGLDISDVALTAAVIPETNLVTVTALASDPGTAFLAAQAVLQRHFVVTDHVVGKIGLDVLQNPAVPTEPVNTSGALRNMVLMAPAAALAAAAFICWASCARDMVRSAQEARRKLSCSYLGELPHERNRRRKTGGIRIAEPTTGYRYTESIRKLRRRVERHMEGEKVLAVTSLMAGEGKTTVAVNLALSLARKYPRVLLVDGDLHRSTCCRMLGQQAACDIRDVLRGRAEPAAAVVPWGKTGLDLLPAAPTADSRDRLTCEALKKLLDWARENYDFVVLDLPPVSVALDLECALECADAALLVVRQNGAPAPALNKGIDFLRSGKARLLGCVLNDVYATVLSEGQGYGEYGGYDGYRYYSSGNPGR